MHRRLLPLLALLACAQLHAATLYISDELTVPMRRGPSNGHKIIHAALPSGMALEVLGEDTAAGFTQVRTPNGTEGWVPTQYLTAQPVAKDRLAAANRRIQSLEAELKSLRENYQEVRGARSVTDKSNADLTRQTQQLQAELAEVRRVSATSLAQYEENKTLKGENQRLTTEVNELTTRNRELSRNTQLHWLLGGGALVLLGFIVGAIIKSRPKRSSWA